jgi:argininosuccinate lyase
MEDTGRIRSPLATTARRIVFDRDYRTQIETDLPLICRVDRAHLVMLVECGILESVPAARLLGAIEHLFNTGFEALRSRQPTRGLYLAYEDYLIETEGAQVGGLLQTARSRNDLGATVLRLRLRPPYLALLREALRLQVVLLRRAQRFSGVVFPIYTHGQAAIPGTYGHYMAAVAEALDRDLRALTEAIVDLDTCPLGAAVGGGNALPIDPKRTAQLLGFLEPRLNSLDAVATRDLILRLLAAMAIYESTLSRLASDLLQWSTEEFAFIRFPDELVGSSSAMPQKRNPFLLEVIQGRSSSALGALVSAAGAMQKAPFTNCVAVNSEGVSPVWQALQQATDVTVLARLLLAGARVNAAAMMNRARLGLTTATETANRLAFQTGLDFRTAHRLVGQLVLAMESRTPLDSATESYFRDCGLDLSLTLDPADVATSSEWGGGPGPESLNTCLLELRRRWAQHMAFRRSIEVRWASAEHLLDRAGAQLVNAVSQATQN